MLFYHSAGGLGSYRRCQTASRCSRSAVFWYAQTLEDQLLLSRLRTSGRFPPQLRLALPRRLRTYWRLPSPFGPLPSPQRFPTLHGFFHRRRTREARYNSWDKNDPKDCQVILHLLQTGTTQIYNDPLVNHYNDLQEMSNTYRQVSLRKVQIQHAIFTHYLPLYFPEAERYCHSSRAEWFTQLLLLTPCPAAVLAYGKLEFIDRASKIVGRKVDKQRFLADFYESARSSIAVPVAADSEAIAMFGLVLEQYLALCRLRQKLEKQVQQRLADHTDFKRLQTIPGIGPVLAMTILAESGDLRRFSHHRKFLKYCGLDLPTTQSGQFRGQPRLSKRGNARLRYALWMAGAVAVRMRQNGFRRKYEDYIRRDPLSADLKRKAHTAVAAKMARVVYAVIKSETDYHRFDEAVVTGGRIHSQGP